MSLEMIYKKDLVESCRSVRIMINVCTTSYLVELTKQDLHVKCILENSEGQMKERMNFTTSKEIILNCRLHHK